MKIKAIPTEYNDYTFKSRLEARWAIFFDELHIPYAYEPEGFELGAIRYLPDFHFTEGLFLHNFGLTQPSEIWVEIKPTPKIANDERQKIAAFVKQTDNHILRIGGQPDFNAPLMFIDHHPEAGWFNINVRWLELPDGRIGLVPTDQLNNDQLVKQTNTPRLRQAIKKARQADFGHNSNIHTPHSRQNQKCVLCGTPFSPLQGNHRFCRSCYLDQREQRTDKIASSVQIDQICKVCGTSFHPRHRHHHLCYSCYTKKRDQEKVTTAAPSNQSCVSCGKSFPPLHGNHRFCRDCYLDQRNNTTIKREKDRTSLPKILTVSPEITRKHKTTQSPDLPATPDVLKTQGNSFPDPPIPPNIPNSKTHLSDTPPPPDVVSSPVIEKVPPSNSIVERLRSSSCLVRIIVFMFIFLIIGVVGLQLTKKNTFLAPSPTPTPTIIFTPRPTATIRPSSTPTAHPSTTESCNCMENQYDCSDFQTHTQAQDCYDHCAPLHNDIHYLDQDGDGVACETLP